MLTRQVMFADPTLTVDSLVGVMDKMTSDEGKRRKVWRKVLWWGSRTPSSYLDEVYTKYTTDKEKTHACSDIYINCRPESSWEHLTSLLYKEDEMTAVDQARQFLPPRGKWITSKQHLMLVGGRHGCRFYMTCTCMDRGHMCHSILRIIHNFEKLIVTITKPHTRAQVFCSHCLITT